VHVRALSLSLLVAIPVTVGAAQSWKNTAPESFKANAQITNDVGGAASVVAIQIDKYTSDDAPGALVKALKDQGNDAFLQALHQAPAIGSVKIGARSVPVRWARERREGDGRRIAIVTDGALFFAGAGAVDAKPTTGFDVAVLEFTIDSVGLGKGTMAGAARVKAGGATGIEIEDYAGKRITLVSVTRTIS